METELNRNAEGTPRVPWNKSKMIGSKPPLRTKNVWSIRTKLQVEGRLRDLAMFNVAIDSKLRGCDVVTLKVEDIAPHGAALDRATVRQRKTGHPVRFELTEQTREAIDAYIKAAGRRPGDFLFQSRRFPGRSLTTRQCARLVSGWIASIGLDAAFYGTHSLRRTRATLIYRRTGNLRAVQLLLGHRRKHGPLSRDQGRRRLGYRRAGGRLNYLGRADMLCPRPKGGFRPRAVILAASKARRHFFRNET
jgi:integrase